MTQRELAPRHKRSENSKSVYGYTVPPASAILSPSASYPVEGVAMSGDPLEGAREHLEVAREAIDDANEKLEQAGGVAGGGGGDKELPTGGVDLSGGSGKGEGTTDD